MLRTCTMALLFRILCVLTALVGSSCTLSCTSCAAFSSTSCTGPSVPCASGNVCGATYVYFQIGGLTFPTYVLSCMPKSECAINGTSRFHGGGQVKFAQSCCTTDNCIPTFPSEPEDNSVPNGLTCPPSKSVDIPWSKSFGTMQCKNKETMCFTTNTKISGGLQMSLPFTGCATQDVCDFFNGSPLQLSEVVTFDASCTKATASDAADSSNHEEL
ncbi:phospholipase A2 inhibitor gamma subunit B-like isoform X2 [Pyxicephalus adspersus]